MKMKALSKIPWPYLFTEGIVVVISILLAFSIDAWWDANQEASRRQELAFDLRAEFEYTIAEVDTEYAWLEEHHRSLQEFLSLVDRNEIEDITILGGLSLPAFQVVTFSPSVIAYQSAASAGTLSLVNSREFSQAMTEVSDGMFAFAEIHRIAGDMYFSGTGSDIRSMYGDLTVLRRDPAEFDSKFRLDDTEVREALTSELVYAHCYKMMIIKSNKMKSLARIKDSLLKAIDALELES